MAVHKVFWEDPYLTSLSATITSIKGGTLTLDKTLFYVFSGNQASDRGTIGRWTWKIHGYARVSCGGTHPYSTKEIGDVTLRRVNIGANKERIEITLI